MNPLPLLFEALLEVHFAFFAQCWHVEHYKDNDWPNASSIHRDARTMIVRCICDSRMTIVLTRFDRTIIAGLLCKHLACEHRKTVVRSLYDNGTTHALQAKNKKFFQIFQNFMSKSIFNRIFTIDWWLKTMFSVTLSI